jgi:isopenicillin-N epimerase
VQPCTSCRQEVLTTEHEHVSHDEAIQRAADRRGARVRRVRLHDGGAAAADSDALVRTIVGAPRPETRVVALSWVYADTGLKLPVGRIADAPSAANAGRPSCERILLVLDATHGFGNQEDTVPHLGCDFFVADMHAWLYGPRGTGLVYGRSDLRRSLHASIGGVTDVDVVDGDGERRPGRTTGERFTSGDCHGLEHRWAAAEAFAFHERVGRASIAGRVRALARRCKDGLAAMRHVRLHTPMDDALSAGLVCFAVEGICSTEAAERLLERRVIAAVAPYESSHLRFCPGIYNSEDDVDAGLAAVRALV